jgi:hypothetical protein
MAELRFYSQFTLTANSLPATLDGLSTALTDYANGAGALGLIVKSDFLWYAYILSSR